jgi:site-specific recombinase XerD
VSWSRFNQAVCALRFFYGVTLRRPGLVQMLPYGKKPKALPCVLSQDEVRRLFDAVSDPRFRLLLQTAYAAGLRVSEVVRPSLRCSTSSFRPNKSLRQSRQDLGEHGERPGRAQPAGPQAQPLQGG